MILYKKVLFLLVLILLIPTYIFSQSSFQTWPTIEVSGEIIDDLDIKFKFRSKYDHDEKGFDATWFNMGLSYKYEKMSFGLFFRQIYAMKDDDRFAELRPHFDLSYKINDNLKLRLRNEYRIFELNNNIFRYRLRLAYSLNIWDNYNPFFQNEINFSEGSLVRDRIILGLSIKIKDSPFQIVPSYILESNRKESSSETNSFLWSFRNIINISCNIKF
ncbi:MAG: hypothetical protein CMG25_06255 [Candidatus Marinimicrobia bacterium]|nr:hypothetical protein [Candidatus Neomarinimicrobiota bacterium]